MEDGVFWKNNYTFQGFPSSIKGWGRIPQIEGESEILLGEWDYRVVGTWGGVILTIQTFSIFKS